MDADLRDELLAMAEQDQDRRWRAIEANEQDAASAWDAVAEVDRRNTLRMKQIVARSGWPGRTLVGEDGAHAAWLLVQHGTHDLEFQQECLTLLAAAVGAGEAAAVDHAYLVDRVAVQQEHPQVYGTQFRRDGDRYVPAPIRDPETVDDRRRGVGLSTLAEYADQINRPPQRPARGAGPAG